MPASDAANPEPSWAWSETDTCAFGDCTRGAIRAALLCDHHWSALPDQLKRELGRALTREALRAPDWPAARRRAQTDALNYLLALREGQSGERAGGDDGRD